MVLLSSIESAALANHKPLPDPRQGKEMTCDDLPSQGLVDANVMRQEFCDAEERRLREILAVLQENYAKAAKPYLDRLAEMHVMRQPATMILTLEQARDFRFVQHNAELRGDSSLIVGSQLESAVMQETR